MEASREACKIERKLCDAIFREIRNAIPGAAISVRLRAALAGLDKERRKEIVSMVEEEEYCPPLFLACRQGNQEIVEYLIVTCAADIEQTGVDEKFGEGTPLWVSVVWGRIDVVKCLVECGAKVNAVCDDGYTILQRACIEGDFDVVRFLVEHGGADVGQPSINGLTCLMKATHRPSICKYLADQGVDVNSQDNQLKTALHHAIEDYETLVFHNGVTTLYHAIQAAHFIDTIEVLIAHDADPFLKNRDGDDAFQTVCLTASTEIFPYILTTKDLPRERQAELYELMGATCCLSRRDPHEDIQTAFTYWKRAMGIRYGRIPPVPKKALGYNPHYAASQLQNNWGNEEQTYEFKTDKELADLERLATVSQVRLQSIFIAERILGPLHPFIIAKLEEEADICFDSGQYLMSIHLWQYAFELRTQKDSFLSWDACCTASMLIKVYHHINQQRDLHPNAVSDMISTFQLLLDQLLISAELLQFQPVSNLQQGCFDLYLSHSAHLLYLLIRAPKKTKDESFQLRKMTKKLVGSKFKFCCTGNFLLHVAVSKTKALRYVFPGPENPVFPSEEVAKYLVECGASVNAVNRNRETALHLAAADGNFNPTVVDILVENGAHLDQLDNQNQSPLALLKRKKLLSALNYFPLEPLSCIAARAVVDYGLIYKDEELPNELRGFIKLHGPMHK